MVECCNATEYSLGILIVLLFCDCCVAADHDAETERAPSCHDEEDGGGAGLPFLPHIFKGT